MSSIAQVDKNLQVATEIKEDDIAFFDVRSEVFRIHGLCDDKVGEQFRRIPEPIAKSTSEGVYLLHTNTAGGRVRFQTNSNYIALHTKMPNVTRLSHMTLAGTSGFDLYINKNGKSIYYKTFMPPTNMQDGYESIIYFDSNEMKDITIYFPLYNDVSSLFIGIQKDSSLVQSNGYKFQKPVVYYGSSITQGGCASRPGNSYSAILSRLLDCDFINMGFSGNGKAEEAIVEYMSDLEMSVFVCDYDHNAPNVEYLEATHSKMYHKIREKQSTLPILFLSKPDYDNGIQNSIQRRDVIYQTYINALKSGDKHVYFIDGYSLFGGMGRDSCTVDGCHPNDLGFMRMAEALYEPLSLIFSAI